MVNIKTDTITNYAIIFCVLLLVIAVGLSMMFSTIKDHNIYAEHICYPVENYTTTTQSKHGNQTVILNMIEPLHNGYCNST